MRFRKKPVEIEVVSKQFIAIQSEDGTEIHIDPAKLIKRVLALQDHIAELEAALRHPSCHSPYEDDKGHGPHNCVACAALDKREVK